MKFPQIPTIVVFFFYSLFSFSQTNSLNAIPSGIYVDTDIPDIKSTLRADAYEKLLKAFEVADLEELLGMSGPFTLFAPSNNALDRFSPAEWDDLFKLENRKKLKDLLTYHLVAGNLTASKILRALCKGEGKASFTTVQGTKLHATIQGTDIVLSDAVGNKARITAADANQSNGVIHQIDSIIAPSRL